MRDLRRSEQGTLNAVAQPEAEGRPSAFLLKGAFMRILSIMIDESGNFDMKRYKNPLYCLTLVFHDQDNDIRMTINDFDALLRQRGYSTEKAIHTTPLIRKEPPYSDLGKFERKALFRMTASFINRLPIRYMTFTFDKSESDTYRSLLYKMARTLDSFIEEHLAFFHGFDRLILYMIRDRRRYQTSFRQRSMHISLQISKCGSLINMITSYYRQQTSYVRWNTSGTNGIQG